MPEQTPHPIALRAITLSRKGRGKTPFTEYYSPLFRRFLIHRTVPVAERITTVSVVT
jgi:hypothetical protein